MNRKIIQSELEKIKGFFIQKKIKKDELLEILNIKDNTNFDEIRDNALIGEKIKINKLLSEIEFLNEDSFFYLNNLNQIIIKLLEILKINENQDNYEQSIESFTPQIFWKDKPIFIKQLKKWSLKKLNKATSKISETEILMKKNFHLRNNVLIKNLIIDLTKEASTYQ